MEHCDQYCRRQQEDVIGKVRQSDNAWTRWTGALGAASETLPKFILKVDTAAQWPACLAYA